MSGSITALAKLGIGPADPVDTAMNFSSFDPGVRRELGDYNGTRGKFWKDSNRILENRQSINPRFSGEPTAPELAAWLPFVMGGAATGTTTKTYPWSDTPLAMFLHFKPVAGEQWFVGNAAVDTATFSAQSGGALSLDVDMVARSFDATRSDMPSLTYDTSLQPFLLSHLALTVGGVDRKPRAISFVVTGGIDRDRYLNSLNLTTLQRLSANQAVTFEVPSGDNASQFWAAGVAGAAATATFTNASTGAVFTLDFPKLRWDGNSPVHAPGGEGFVSITANAVSTGGGAVSTITLSVGS